MNVFAMAASGANGENCKRVSNVVATAEDAEVNS
jgi:hypothetical protein